MEGGAPAGLKTLPGAEGCRRKRRHINIITRQGNKRTSERGSETLELPFSRMRRRKKPEGILGIMRSVFSVQLDGKGGGEGTRFVSCCTNPIGAVDALRARQAHEPVVVPPRPPSIA